jgi:hypothetical protein
MAMTTPSRSLSGEQRRALDMLARSPSGCTEGALRANGFKVGVLAGLMRAGLAVANPESVRAGGRTLAPRGGARLQDDGHCEGPNPRVARPQGRSQRRVTSSVMGITGATRHTSIGSAA